MIKNKMSLLLIFSALSCYFQSCDESEPANDSSTDDIQELNDLVAEEILINDMSDPTVEENTIADFPREDFDVSGDGSGGCDQNLPNITTLATEHCDTHFPVGNCLLTGCDDCEVCYADVSCSFPDPALDPLPCGCYGDGLCHKLCETNADCLESEECINLGWYAARDVMCASHTKVCWSPENPYSPTTCP